MNLIYLQYTLLLLIRTPRHVEATDGKGFTIHFDTINTKRILNSARKNKRFTIHFATINTKMMRR